MPSLQDIRQQYPQYHDLTDKQLADGLYAKHYSDMPRTDFDAKIGFQDQPRGKLVDVGAQLAQGATFGLGDEAIAGVAALRGAFDKKKLSDIGADYAQGLDTERQAEKKFSNENPATAIGAQLAGGLMSGVAGGVTNAGKAIASGLSTGGLPARIAGSMGLGAATGAAYGFGSGEGDENRIKGAESGAVAGAALGGALPLAGAGIGLAKRAVVPSVEQNTAALAQRAQDFGIPLRLDQIAPTRTRKGIQKISQVIPLSGVDTFEKSQRSAFNKAVAGTIGQPDAADLSPSTINAFRLSNGDKFDSVFKDTKFTITPQVQAGIQAIAGSADSALDAGLAKVVQTNVNDTLEQLSKGELSGEKLASIRSELLKNSVRSQSSASEYIGDIIDHLDNVAESQLPPAKIAQLAQARREWRNFKTIKPLLEKSTDGEINPTELINRVASSRYINASGLPTGADDLVDLARIGKDLMPKAGGSDTFDKSLLAGTTIGSMTNPVVALGSAATIGGNRAFQAVNQSQSLVKKAITEALLKSAPKSVMGAAKTSANSDARDQLTRRFLGRPK